MNRKHITAELLKRPCPVCGEVEVITVEDELMGRCPCSDRPWTLRNAKQEGKMKLMNGVKTIKLANGQRLEFYYANNKGRGTDNVTIMRVSAEVPRAGHSKNQQGVLATKLTSGWAGDVNFSKHVMSQLGVTEHDILK